MHNCTSCDRATRWRDASGRCWDCNLDNLGRDHYFEVPAKITEVVNWADYEPD